MHTHMQCRQQECNIRVLEPEKLDMTKGLQEDCVSFVSKVDEVCRIRLWNLYLNICVVCVRFCLVCVRPTPSSPPQVLTN